MKKGEPEMTILDYPIHQCRLFPKFASLFVGQLFIRELNLKKISFTFEKDPNHKLTESEAHLVEEYHMLTSSAKAEISEIAHEAILESRTACGGLGYSRYSRFGDLLSLNDVNRTWEGDNNVLS